MPSSFPTTIAELAPFLMNAILRLNAHSTRLGVNPAKLAAITALFGDASTKGTYLYYKTQWDDDVSEKTKLVNLQLASISKKMKTGLAEIFRDIPASKWNNDDRLTFNRKTGLPYKKTFHKAPIAEDCSVYVPAPNIGLFHFYVRAKLNNSICSRPPQADALEIAYAVVESNYRQKTDADEKVRKTCLGPDDHTQKHISFKTRFTLQIEVALTGFNLVFYVRWINSRHPQLAGNWCTQLQSIIS